MEPSTTTRLMPNKGVFQQGCQVQKQSSSQRNKQIQKQSTKPSSIKKAKNSIQKRSTKIANLPEAKKKTMSQRPAYQIKPFCFWSKNQINPQSPSKTNCHPSRKKPPNRLHCLSQKSSNPNYRGIKYRFDLRAIRKISGIIYKLSNYRKPHIKNNQTDPSRNGVHPKIKNRNKSYNRPYTKLGKEIQQSNPQKNLHHPTQVCTKDNQNRDKR